MSFIDDLRTLVAAAENKDVAKALSVIGSNTAESIGNAAIDNIAGTYGGPIVPLAHAGWRIAENISDMDRWKNANKSGTYIEGRVDDKSEDELNEGQGGNTTPVEQKDTEEKSSPDYDLDEMAGEFILGAWGNGQDRIDNMINAGYSIDDYNKIQQRVNEAYESGRDLHEWTNKANEKLKYW